MDAVVLVIQVVSMFAALAAAYFARDAVLETKALRREDRIARLLDLVAEVGESGTRAARGQAGENLLIVAQHRLRAALKAADEPLPECERLLGVEWPSYVASADATEREEAAVDVLAAALDEVAALLVRLRA